MMYDGKAINEVSKKDLMQHILDAVDCVIDEMIEKYKLVEDHPFVFIQNYANNTRPREVSTQAYAFLHQNLQKYIMDNYKDNKDDIKAVWRKAGLL